MMNRMPLLCYACVNACGYISTLNAFVIFALTANHFIFELEKPLYIHKATLP